MLAIKKRVTNMNDLEGSTQSDMSVSHKKTRLCDNVKPEPT